MRSYLVIETSSSVITLMLKVSDEISFRQVSVERNKLNRLQELVREMLTELECGLEEVEFIATSVGPGSFTGIRIGAAFAQSIAYGLAKPIVTFSSLQAFAQTYHEMQKASEVIILNDARMQEYYMGHYKLDPNHVMQVVGAESLIKDFEKEKIEKQSVAVVTNENIKLSELSLIRLVESLAVEQAMISPLQLKLNYLRNNVAQRKVNG